MTKMDIIEHLKSRWLDLSLHAPVISQDDCLATFYLYNLSGQIIGYQQYNPLGDKKVFNDKAKAKYYTYCKTPTLKVRGVESLLEYKSGPVFVTEGLFDAARMIWNGFAAVAILCNNPPREYFNWLSSLAREVVVVADGDSAGSKLLKLSSKNFICPDGEDLGSVNQSFITNLLDELQLPRN